MSSRLVTVELTEPEAAALWAAASVISGEALATGNPEPDLESAAGKLMKIRLATEGWGDHEG